jgi:hypothetical protein
LDEFCFRHKRIEKKHFDYNRNSYRDEFINSSHASPRFFHGPNHRSYGFGLQESNFVPRSFGYDPRPYHDDRPPRRHGFPTRGGYSHFESSRFDGPRFLVVVHVPLVQMVPARGAYFSH